MRSLSITLPGETATTALGLALARVAAPGRPILLSGPLGAGKSHLARAAIRALTHDGQEVPSPSFTLIQTYEASGAYEASGTYEAGEAGTPIHHVDLYRLGNASELEELGLAEAMETGITLLEWPERLEEMPAGALHVAFTDRDPRAATLTWDDPAWDGPARAARADAFLTIAGIDAPRVPLPGDWSARRYVRSGGAILMDTAPEEAERSARIYGRLRAAGLAAPEILAGPDAGLLLTEDHGDVSLGAYLERHPDREADLYLSCTDAILAAQRAPASDLPPYGPAEMAEATRIAAQEIGGGAWIEPLRDALAAHDGRGVLILRDFHAENVILRPGAGLARIGLIDTQDAMRGHPAYDLASLLWDARRDVGADTRAACAARFIEASGADPAALDAQLALLTAQRAIRILGILVRLGRQGREMPAHVAPRVRGQLADALAHPAAAGVAEAMDLP